MVDQIGELMRKLPAPAENGLVTVSDIDLLKAAWGNRRVSSRTRNMDISAYPKAVTAHPELWRDWFKRVSANPDIDYVIIAKKKAQARIDAALGSSFDTEQSQSVPMTPITQDEVEDMLAERLELRAEKRWADADKIRDYLVAHGIQVRDAKS